MATDLPWTYDRFEQWAVWSAGKFPTTEQGMRLRLYRQFARKCTPNADAEASLRDRATSEPALEDAADSERGPWIDRAIEALKAQELIDDRLAAAAMVTAMRRKGMSRRAMLARLRQKGVSPNDCSAAVERDDTQSPETDPDFEAALRYLERRRLGPFGKNPATGPVAPDTFQNALRALIRVGFAYETAYNALCHAVEVSRHPDQSQPE